MSIRRVLRLILGIIVAGALLAFLLPFVGVPSSHYLPPGRVYATAEGTARGQITNKYNHGTGNPFQIGTTLYFVDYQFEAPSPPPRGTTEPGPKQTYTGELRVEKDIYDGAKAGGLVHVKYEKTYPWVNGVTDANLGRSIGEGSNILSGWLIWVVATLVLGYLLMFVFDRFGSQEDI